VSLRWNKSVQLHLGARQLHATLQPAWLHSRPWARRQPAAASPGKGITVTSALAQPAPEAVAALLAELAQQVGLHQASLHVTLADAHVLFDVVAGPFAAYSDPQLQTIARGCVTELLGDAAAGQAVCWQLQPDLRHLLVCAMDRPLIDSLVQAAALHRMRLESLQPAFCQHWNRHVRALPHGSGIFTVLDAGRSLVACVLRGSITALSYGAWTTPDEATRPSQALDQKVDRLLASVGQQAQELVDFVLLAREPLGLPPSPRWTVLHWQEEAE
jgi:hypothetical protein